MFLRPLGNGVVIEGGTRIAIDVPKRVKGAVHIVTHAHSDHTGALRYGPGFAEKETAEILKVLGLDAVPVEALRTEDVDVYFPYAGHIVGSVQVLLVNGEEVLVTGDFKLESDVIVRGAETPDADVLVMDTTFGVPYFRFPRRRTLYRQLNTFVRENLAAGRSVVLFAYRVGKTQELTALLNSWGIAPYVLPETHRVNALFGLKDRVLRSVPTEPAVLILPPKFRRVLDALSFQTGVEHVGLFASGWNRELPLSSHADWYQTVEFVERVSPELVITYGANATPSAEFLRREGFDAVPLTKQLLL